MTDSVAITLITTISGTIASIVTAIVSVVNNRRIKEAREEIKQEGAHTRALIDLARRQDDGPPSSGVAPFTHIHRSRADDKTQ